MRRAVILFVALVLYALFLSTTWIIGGHQAAKSTEAQLDYAVLDFRDTVAGAVDTMLGNVARIAVRQLGRAEARPVDEIAAVTASLDIDELNVVSREGVIIASSDPASIGVVMAGDPVMDQFMSLTNEAVVTVSQPFRKSTVRHEIRAKYLGFAFPDSDGFVQVGLYESHLAKILPDMLGYIFNEWLLGETGFFLCADSETGVLISNPSRHLGKARMLAETGFDVQYARPFVSLSRSDRGRTFVQRLFGEKCYCRYYFFGGHSFVAALPEREYYGTRNILTAVFAVLLLAVIATFAWFFDRMFRDADRLKAFYSAEEELRAKDFAIARTIQNAALPNSFSECASYRLAASMVAAKEVGGDFYDFFQLDSNHFVFLVADVSGKGVTAALYMMTAKTLIKDALMDNHDPAAALTAVNAELCRNNPANMFLTAWVGVLDLETGLVTFVNAGHNPPVHMASGGCGLLTKKSGPVLAFMDGLEYRARTVQLEKGDALFLYTDGVTEALNARNELFGEKRLLECLWMVQTADPGEMCHSVRSAVSAFAQGAPQADDITVLAIRYITPPEAYARSFPPTQAGIAATSAFLDEVLKPSRVPQAVIAAAHVIVDEICSNIVKHSGASGFELDITIANDPGSLRMCFIDNGAAYDPLAHADPDTTLPAEARPIGGLGILMVKRMSDSVSYNRDHNRNFFTVVKRF